MKYNLQTMDIDEMLKPMIPNYVVRRKKDLEQFKDFMTQKNFEQIAHLAHKIKGNGTSYGFPKLTEISGSLENAAMGKNLNQTQVVIQQYESEVKKIMTDLGVDA